MIKLNNIKQLTVSGNWDFQTVYVGKTAKDAHLAFVQDWTEGAIEHEWEEGWDEFDATDWADYPIAKGSALENSISDYEKDARDNLAALFGNSELEDFTDSEIVAALNGKLWYRAG